MKWILIVFEVVTVTVITMLREALIREKKDFL